MDGILLAPAGSRRDVVATGRRGRTSVRKSAAWFGVSVGLVLGLTELASAEEGGSGHYLPGANASFIDAGPSATTFVTRLDFVYYRGSFDAPLPIAGLVAVDVEAKTYANILTGIWRPPIDVVEGLSFSIGAAIPVVWLDVAIGVDSPAATVRRSDNFLGLGDLYFLPFILSYAILPDLHVDGRLGIYAPTGAFEAGRLANSGKNYWSFEPTLGALYFGLKNGIEASVYAGVDFNTENTATEYHSGFQLHVDGTLAQHFPLWGGLAGAGVSAFGYQQITGDEGEGARLGAFEARTFGVGPVLSFTAKVGDFDVGWELKWLHEFLVERRLEGDYGWFKVFLKPSDPPKPVTQ